MWVVLYNCGVGFENCVGIVFFVLFLDNIGVVFLYWGKVFLEYRFY